MTDARDVNAPHSGVFEGPVHVLPVRIYYEDTDFSGAVYHANYLKYFERGRSEFLRKLGVGHKELLASPDPCAFAVTSLKIDFLKAARIDDALEVHTTFRAIKGPRFLVDQDLYRHGGGVCSASVEIVCIGRDQNGSGSARKPPKDLLDALRPYLNP